MISAKIPVKRDYMSLLGGSQASSGLLGTAAGSSSLVPKLQPDSSRTAAGQQSDTSRTAAGPFSHSLQKRVVLTVALYNIYPCDCDNVTFLEIYPRFDVTFLQNVCDRSLVTYKLS